MLNFVVVDDNKLQRKSICNCILRKMMNNKIEFSVQEFSDYNKSLVNYISSNKNDNIYILDLELPSGDGIDIARIIRNKYNNWNSPIIIITAHTSLYYEVYKQRLQVLDFIGKCENVEKNLSENIDICLKMLNKEKVYRYTYKNVEYTINLNHINYIQRDGRKVKIVTCNGDYYQNISISEIRNLLPSYFMISAKGVLINMKNVSKIDWSTQLVHFNDQSKGFLVSRSHKKELDNYELV